MKECGGTVAEEGQIVQVAFLIIPMAESLFQPHTACIPEKLGHLRPPGNKDTSQKHPPNLPSLHLHDLAVLGRRTAGDTDSRKYCMASHMLNTWSFSVDFSCLKRR